MSEFDKFLSMAKSLSRYRRAEIKDNDGSNLIEELYVDPLSNDLVLKSLLKDDTVLLIGRKGTGKSTIINRFQHEVRKKEDRLSIYIDIKSLFEQCKSRIQPSSDVNNGLSIEDSEKLELYKVFTKEVVEQIKREIKDCVFKSRYKIFTKRLTKKSFEEEIDKITYIVDNPSYKDITAVQEVAQKEQKDSEIKASLVGSASIKPSVNSTLEQGFKNIDSSEYAKILQRHFNIISLMKDIKNILEKVNINRVYVCLDDVSEIEKDSMDILTRLIIAPLNNLSDEFFKFVLSLYPSRDHLPEIDRQKAVTFMLDYYDLYSASNASKVEEEAVKYTQRLLEARFKYYFGKDVSFHDYFEISSDNNLGSYFKLIFQISSNVPRIMGKILYIALSKTDNFSKKINKTILKESAREHYKNEVEYILSKNESIEYKSYDESFEQYHLYELLKKIILKAKDNKSKIGLSNAKIFEKYTTNTAPSNYLFVRADLENILKTLEFNFFITKYSHQKDKDGEDVCIFSLNYGMCVENSIIYDDKSDRKFRIQRVFDFNSLINDWMQTSKELACSSCEKTYPLEQKDVFIKYKFPCSDCKGKVELKPILEDKDRCRLDNKFKLPKKDLDVLNILRNRNDGMKPKELGLELDRTYQSISWSLNSSKIKDNNLVNKYNSLYFISENGKSFLNGDFKINK